MEKYTQLKIILLMFYLGMIIIIFNFLAFIETHVTNKYIPRNNIMIKQVIHH